MRFEVFGWSGWALELVNLSNDRQPITIKRGDPLMHIEFITRLGKPSPYSGPYMFQYITDEEAELYSKILLEKFPREYDRAKVESMLKDRIR
ncbi:MAG: hypothetical protein QXK34_01100 [Candidatus Bathyarchaeia archaeon]